jgi:uncharacterized protein YdaU (DUF1376 family)
MRFYKHDPDAFLAGTSELTFEQCGAYIRLINLLYSHDDVLADDDNAIARMMGCQLRRWQRLKAQLIRLGKVHVVGDMIHANGVTNVCLEAQEFSFRQRKRVSKRWENFKIAKEFKERLIRPRNTTTTNNLDYSSTSLEAEANVDTGDKVAEQSTDQAEPVPKLKATSELEALVKRKQQFDKDWR